MCRCRDKIRQRHSFADSAHSVLCALVGLLCVFVCASVCLQLCSRFVTSIISLKIRWTHWYIWKIYNTPSAVYLFTALSCSFHFFHARFVSPQSFRLQLLLLLLLVLLRLEYNFFFFFFFVYNRFYIHITLHSLTLRFPKCCNDPNVARAYIQIDRQLLEARVNACIPQLIYQLHHFIQHTHSHTHSSHILHRFAITMSRQIYK